MQENIIFTITEYKRYKKLPLYKISTKNIHCINYELKQVTNTDLYKTMCDITKTINNLGYGVLFEVED